MAAGRRKIQRPFGRVLTVLLLALVGFLSLAGLGLYLYRFIPPQERAPTPYTAPQPAPDEQTWTAYGGDPGQTRHSKIRQIDRSNVGHLREAWTYRTGELARRGRWAREGKFQNTPILAAGNLIVCTPFNRVVALDPATGTERWVYDPEIVVTSRPDERFNCRGLARWSDVPNPGGANAAGVACAERLFMRPPIGASSRSTRRRACRVAASEPGDR
jgi:glucose dehydrogenase